MIARKRYDIDTVVDVVNLSALDSQLGLVRVYPANGRRLSKRARVQLAAAAAANNTLPTFVRWSKPSARPASDKTYFEKFREEERS